MTRSPWFRERAVRVPTLRTVAVASLASVILFVGLFLSLHPFLARDDPAPNAELIVIEGWLPDYAIAAAVEEFQRGRYRHIYTTGGRVTTGSHLSGHRTWAGLAKATARQLGVPDSMVTSVPAQRATRGRTFVSAWSLKHKLERDCVRVESLLVYTLGAHARRSQLAFQRVFGDDVVVGVIAVPSRAYDPSRWWTSSHGLKEVIWQSIAWSYEWLAGDRTAPASPDRCSGTNGAG